MVRRLVVIIAAGEIGAMGEAMPVEMLISVVTATNELPRRVTARPDPRALHFDVAELLSRCHRRTPLCRSDWPSRGSAPGTAAFEPLDEGLPGTLARQSSRHCTTSGRVIFNQR